MMIEKYIKELLFEHNCVVVPGFGGFITNYVGAGVHPVKNTFTPPSKKMAFNESLQLNDGLLAATIAYHEQKDIKEALNAIEDFVKEIKQGLKKIKIYTLDGIGKFVLHNEDNIQFEPENKNNYLEDSFGLPELYFKPIERDYKDMNRPVPPRRPGPPKRPVRPPVRPPEKGKKTANDKETTTTEGSKGKIWFAIIPLLLLVGAAVYIFVIDENSSKLVADLNPFADNEKTITPAEKEEETTKTEAETAPVIVEEETPEEEVPAEVEETVAPAPVTASASGKYHIIVGAFEVPENAKNYSTQVNGTILNPSSSNLKMVSVASYASMQEAENALAKYKSTYGSQIWILNY